MTGRIFTADHQVYDLPPLLEWNVKQTGSVPCDSWSVTAVYQAEMAPVLKMAAGFAAMENGAAQLRGIVDEYSVELGSGGAASWNRTAIWLFAFGRRLPRFRRWRRRRSGRWGRAFRRRPREFIWIAMRRCGT